MPMMDGIFTESRTNKRSEDLTRFGIILARSILIISFYICVFTFVFFISFHIYNLKLRVERCYA